MKVNHWMLFGVFLLSTLSRLHAGCVKFQNSISKTLYISVAYYDHNNWTSQGWYELTPGSTKTLIVNNCNRYVYWYATIKGETANYSGSHYFYIDPRNRFTYYFADTYGIPENKFGFQEIDVGNYDVFTFQIVHESHCDGNCDDGIGTYYYPDNNVYNGSWKNGKKNGQGVLKWSNGSRYEGAFSNDQLNGTGTMYWPDGTKYTGEFLNGNIQGRGVFTYISGEELQGIWENNTFTYNGELHLFLVMNTNDPNVGGNAKHIKQNFSDLYEQICRVGKFKLVKHIISGNNFNPDYIKSTVSNFKCGSNDVVVFHYFGHGGRLENTTGQWPLLQVSNTQSLRESGISLEWFRTKLYYQTSARLGLFFADCCNYEWGNLTPCANRKASLIPAAEITQGAVETLFLKRSGSMLASSSSPGQASYPWDEKESSFYTVFFLQSISDALTRPQPNWKGVLDNVTKEVSSLTGDCAFSTPQTPQFDISTLKIR